MARMFSTDQGDDKTKNVLDFIKGNIVAEPDAAVA